MFFFSRFPDSGGGVPPKLPVLTEAAEEARARVNLSGLSLASPWGPKVNPSAPVGLASEIMRLWATTAFLWVYV